MTLIREHAEVVWILLNSLGKKINAEKLSWNERAMGPVTVSAPFALQIAA